MFITPCVQTGVVLVYRPFCKESLSSEGRSRAFISIRLVRCSRLSAFIRLYSSSDVCSQCLHLVGDQKCGL